MSRIDVPREIIPHKAHDESADRDEIQNDILHPSFRKGGDRNHEDHHVTEEKRKVFEKCIANVVPGR